ncbi:MAG TPA: hypothetical protein ENI73_08490 [Spirochaetes bacterium]|nr:hypothetical protein [Spirochaetota bacterium]
MKACYHCKTEWKSDSKPSRTESCENCDRDVHCCLNCQFYDESSYNECHETQAERVLDKEKGNFCDYFNFRQSIPQTPKKPSKKAFDDLFN